MVREDGSGQFIHDIVPTADPVRIKTTALVDGPFFYAEARLPADYTGAPPQATARALDRCATTIAADGQNPPPTAAYALESVDAEATSRYSVWRSRALLGLVEPRRPYQREPVEPISPTPVVVTGGDIIGPPVDLPPDEVADNVVRTGDQLEVEVTVGETSIVSHASPGSQIIDPRHDTGAGRPVNNRVNLCAGERIDALDIEMLAGGRADGWATLDTIDNEKDKNVLDRGEFQFENQHGVLGQFGRAVTLGPFRMPGASGKVRVRGVFIPDGVTGEEFREFTFRDRDSRGSAANPADPMGTTYRNVRVGPAMKVVNLVVQFAGTSRSREQLQRDVRVLDAIYKQACIRFELLDADVVEDPRIGNRVPPDTAFPEDVPDGERANLDKYLDFRKDRDTKLNVFLVRVVHQNPAESNVAGVARYADQFCVVEGALSGDRFLTTLAHELAHLLGDLDDAYPLASDSPAERAAKDRDNHDMLMYHSGQSSHRIPIVDALRCRANPRATTR